MAFSDVLDANVLYPFSLRDTLLRLAELELYAPLWSNRILEEMTRNLIEHRITGEQAARIEAAMTNDPKDRHVLAAAVASDSELIISFDLDDFPPGACDPVGVEVIHPDDVLLHLHDLNPEAVRAALEQQAADLNPPGPSTSSCAHSPKRVCRASPLSCVRSASRT